MPEPIDIQAVESGYLIAAMEIAEELDGYFRRRGEALHGIRLRGIHPGTELVVESVDGGSGEVDEMAFEVWSYMIRGEPMSASSFTGIVAMNVMEGSRSRS
jgi:hypothetical protein